MALLALAAGWPAVGHAAFDQTHAAWSRILATHVRDGAFDYAAVARHPEALRAYLASLEQVKTAEYATFTPKEQLAFWIDAYNAYAVWLIAHKWPVTRVDRRGHLWQGLLREAFIPLQATGGDKLSLDDLAHHVLRAHFDDPRFHFALACGARGCPPLRPEAYVASRLDAQLDDQTRRFLASPAGARYDFEPEVLWLSPIFDWYDGDFRPSVRAFVLRFLPAKTVMAIRLARGRLRLRYLDYDDRIRRVPAAAVPAPLVPTPGSR